MQVEEGDLICHTVRTGAVETPVVVSYAKVFATACLDTEPQTTFVLPSMKSTLDRRTTIAETDIVSFMFLILGTSGHLYTLQLICTIYGLGILYGTSSLHN